LRKKAAPVEVVDDALRVLIGDMFETMYDAPGIGLAATQVDVHKRLLVADVSSDKSEPFALINPEIIEKDGVTVTDEGCLSVPGYYESVERAEHIRVRFLDRNGEAVEMEAEACWRCAYNTRSIISMASCSWITSPRRNASEFARSWKKNGAAQRSRSRRAPLRQTDQ